MNAPAKQSQNVVEMKTGRTAQTAVHEDEFISAGDLLSFERDAAVRREKQALAEINALFREGKWEDIVALVYPVEEKFPDLAACRLDLALREKAAFALGHLKRFDDAIKELQICVDRDPDNFFIHSSMAYTAYDSLYAAKNKDVFLNGKAREERIRLAHRHFQAAQHLRPDGVTNFYREGMLYKQLENKPDKALPLFRRAVENWERLEPAEKEARHQEKKNYVKALYQLAGVLLGRGNAGAALQILKRCLKEDEHSNYQSLLYKYFALGKVHFHLGDFTQAKDALLFALQSEGGQPVDFVCELLAKTYLALKNVVRAKEVIQKVPEKRRRPYYHWTEADVWTADGNMEKARRVLEESSRRDQRSRHKSLVRLAKIDYLRGDYESAFRFAKEAGRFFSEKWGNPLDDSLFWQSLCRFRLSDYSRASESAEALKALNPRYPKLDLLLEKLARVQSGG